jgi:hypothetical protein
MIRSEVLTVLGKPVAEAIRPPPVEAMKGRRT